MSNADLREDALHILDHWIEKKNAHSPQSVLASQSVRLANRFVAEHPADEDEPITVDWLRSVGAKYGTEDHNYDCLYLGCVEYKEGDKHAYIRGLGDKYNIRTRGQLRKLCSTLEIPLEGK